MFNSISKDELLSELRHQDSEKKVVIGVSYGDRSETIQAIPVTSVNGIYLQTSCYSDSGYKLKEDGDQSDEAIEVITLNYDEDYSIDSALTVKELIEELIGGYDDLLIALGANYGDRVSTIQAIGVSEINDAYLSDTSYSLSGYSIVNEGDQEDDALEVVVLNFDILDC